MKNLLLLCSFAVIFSCSENYENRESSQHISQALPPESQYSTPPVDTGTVKFSSSENHESVFPAGKYKTVPEIMKHLFSEGSTKAEVRVVQGQPDLIERIDMYQEVWYYGDCEVHFKGQLVRGVVNDNKAIKYASLYGTLIFSPDRTESNYARFLNDRIMR